ncbi:Phosphatidate cytidylyltransferase [bacterium HR36]|nr:Phosphatidate cytidylyltransferase [bacterium HR36]
MVGSVLIALALAVLVLDQLWAPWYPCLAVAAVGFGLLASWELRPLLPEPRPLAWWMHGGVVAILLANWATPALARLGSTVPPLSLVTFTATLMLLLGFLAEMGRFRGSDGATPRLAHGSLALLWLGVAPSFLVQLRWFGLDAHGATSDLGLWALAFGIFVPKVGDIAAYFIGSLLGRRPLAPVLSPKKTWEGALGGLLGSLVAGSAMVAAAHQFTGRMLLGWPMTVLASLLIGMVAQLSDLAESLIKRDRQVKDTSAYVPGLGGILDTIDSLLFSAPLVWLLLHALSPAR